MCFLEHAFGQWPLNESVDGHWPSSMTQMSIADHFMSIVRLVHFLGTITEKIG